MERRCRFGRKACLVAALGLSASCGGGEKPGARPTTVASRAADTNVCMVPAAPGNASGITVVRGTPRWETVATLKGLGPGQLAPFRIRNDCLQWRARWSCETGRIRVNINPPPRRSPTLIDAACPGTGEAFAIVPDDVRLHVDASGPWEVIVDQQVDTPLLEPLPPDVAAAPVVGQGTFYGVEEEAAGTARVYATADGSWVLRIEDLRVTNNVDLFVWLSEAISPRTSADAVAAPHVVLGNLKSTLGNQNYVLPADLPPERLRSIVIWCEPQRIAYGGASLGR